MLPASILMGTLMRVQVLGMAVSGWFLAGAPLLVAMLFFLMLLGLFSGAQRVAFQLVLGKVIPITRRGQLQAWRNFTGGTIAAALAYAAGRYIVGNAPISKSVRLFGLHLYQNGYATTFFLAFVLTSLGLTAFQLLIREPDPPRVRPRMRVSERLKSLPALLGADRGFAFFMLSQTLAVAGRIAQPFYILYAGHMLHSLSGAVIGILGLANLGADTASNLLWGYLGDRSGFRSSFLIALILWIAGTALLMVSHSMPPIFIAFCASGRGQLGLPDELADHGAGVRAAGGHGDAARLLLDRRRDHGLGRPADRWPDRRRSRLHGCLLGFHRLRDRRARGAGVPGRRAQAPPAARAADPGEPDRLGLSA